MRATILLLVLLAGSCTFKPTLPAGSVLCDVNEDCPADQRCGPPAEPGRRRVCCAVAECPVVDGGGERTEDAGPPGIQVSISSAGGLVSSAAVRVYDDGFEQNDRVCTGSICVTGGITP
jgi:hypothetical protein